MHIKTKNLTRTQRRFLERIKRPRLFDTKSITTNDSDPSPIPDPETTHRQSSSISYPHIDIPHKRDNDDDNHIDQPTSKQPRQLSPSQNTPLNLEPLQLQSLIQNNEVVNSQPNLTFEQKRRQQQDDTQENKKQKHQENADLPTITEYLLPQPIAPTEHITNPTDSPLQLPTTPTPPQIIPKPQTIESALAESTHDNPDQDTTWTHGFKHHSMTTTDQLQPHPLPLIYQVPERPPEYKSWSKSSQAHYRKKFERRHG